MELWNEIYEKMQGKMAVTCERTGSTIPYTPIDGRYVDLKTPTGIYWWTNGFWAGMLWQMFNATGDEAYKTAALGVEKRMDGALEGFVGLHHDVGFQWLHTGVANYRLTGDEDGRRRGLHAAFLLAGRYNPAGKFIRAWNKEHTGWSIVDSMMNLPLLYWAGKELDDPRFAFIANSHADTCIATTLRPDGSCNHIVDLCPHTGVLLDNPGGQGYGSGSAWSRGNSWALYGFALCYRYTGEQRFLDAAKRVAHYFVSNLAIADWLPLVDFRAPAEPVMYDSSAGMVAVCGLLEIAEHVPELEKTFYTQAAHKTLAACEKRFANWDHAVDGMMYGGIGAYHKRDICYDTALIYGDYFFVEAVLRLQGKSFHIW